MAARNFSLSTDPARRSQGGTADACRRLGTEAVDLVVLDDAPAPLGHRVLKRGRLLSGTQPRRRAAVAEDILTQYLDEAYLRRVLDAGLAERLREKRFARSGPA